MMSFRILINIITFFGSISYCIIFFGKQPIPIQFSIPEDKIVKEVPHKDLDFASFIPGNSYMYAHESDYYQGYKRAFYAITKKKWGWDCMRHYEILANGCIPYFLDLDRCNANTMKFLPKELIIEAMNLPGVSYLQIDHSKFDKKRYYEILNKLLEHTRLYLTCRNMATYLLNSIKYTGQGNILYLSNDIKPDYMRCLTLIGLKQLYGNKIVDFPKIEHIYRNYTGNIKGLYGKGITYTKNIDDLPVNRKDIKERIEKKEFDLIIYGSVHRGLHYYDLVTKNYSSQKIVYICGEDEHECPYTNLDNLFLREYPN